MNLATQSFHPTSIDNALEDGITYRQWLAGIIAAGASGSDEIVDQQKFARYVVKIADALIAELEKETK